MVHVMLVLHMVVVHALLVMLPVCNQRLSNRITRARQTHRDRQAKTDRQKGRQIDRQTGRQTDRQAGRQTDRRRDRLIIIRCYGVFRSAKKTT